ncbi:MAG TPA: CBS domain-containing protein [Gemmatimonadaceae bacterium]|nr:CBS domain-containing protein [Gemmatimonadaceae bacterium]
MRLSDHVVAERAVVPLVASELPVAARVLADRLIASGAVQSPGALLERVADERPEDIVAMGDRAFLLHYRTDAVADIAVAIGTAPRPICRQLGDEEEQCARIVLLIVAPPRMAARYLQLVGALARLLSREDVVDAVLDTRNPAELAALPAFRDADIPEQLLVRDIMTENPRTIGPDVRAREGAREMVRWGLGSLPVVDDSGRVVGMLGERDLLRNLLTRYLADAAAGGKTGSAPPRLVRDVMTRQVLCVSPEQPLSEVAALMANKDVDRVPVVREGRLIGFLTRGDIVRKLIGS